MQDETCLRPMRGQWCRLWSEFQNPVVTISLDYTYDLCPILTYAYVCIVYERYHT